MALSGYPLAGYLTKICGHIDRDSPAFALGSSITAHAVRLLSGHLGDLYCAPVFEEIPSPVGGVGSTLPVARLIFTAPPEPDLKLKVPD